MSSRNIGLSIGNAATKANSGIPGAAGFGSAAWIGPGPGGSDTVVTLQAVAAGSGGGALGRSGLGSGGLAGSGEGETGGRPMTERDLPPPDTKRWVMRRKAEVVAGVRCGVISLDEACRRYTLSEEEFRSWQRLIDSHGVRGLRATRLQEYRTGSDDDAAARVRGS